MNLQAKGHELPASLNHHAYFIEGEKSFVLPKIYLLIENILGIKREGNPDYMVLEYENLSIDDARMIKQMSGGQALGEENNSKRIFIITFSNATNEAQNSLLKMFEEPGSSSKFFVIAPSAQIIVPTLRSRFEMIKKIQGEKESREPIMSIEDYFKMKLSEKIKFSKSISEKVSKGEISKLDVAGFVKNISDSLKEKIADKKDFELVKKLKQSLYALGLFSDRSASIKMLLDHLAISIE